MSRREPLRMPLPCRPCPVLRSWAKMTPMLPQRFFSLALLLTACSGDKGGSTGTPSPAAPLLSVRDGRLLDASGRQVLLRGINARVEGLFDVTFDDGRIALEEIPPFTGEDCAFLAETLGMNHLRLPVNWSGIEPHEGTIDTGYLERIGTLVDDCAAVGVLTIVDLHQDAYGKDIGEDGAPLWAIHPPPAELLEGPLTSAELAERRRSPVVLEAFSSLYNNATLTSGQPVRDAYAAMAAELAGFLADHPGAVAIELQNEPVVFGAQDLLDAFHDAVTAEIRAVAPELPVVFEPDAIRNITDTAVMNTPFPWDQAMYGPHIYTQVFEDGWVSEDTGAIEESIARSVEEARFHSAHLYAGEFGNDPRTERGLLFLSTCFDSFDLHQASWALWLYEEHSQDSWGLYDEGDAPHTRGALRAAAVDVIARGFPTATAGRLIGLSWDSPSRTLTVRLEDATSDPHELAVPVWVYPDGVSATCDGTTAAVRATHPGRAEVVCNGSELVVFPQG
ncbi:MAG TPA: hypothetical protein DFR83_12790 [Deltaproteobacteria bacterium]|nr:hypothetical protein [Deltaproteobacteria bacterium]